MAIGVNRLFVVCLGPTELVRREQARFAALEAHLVNQVMHGIETF